MWSQPASKGHVFITSADPYAAPDFRTGFLEEQADVDVHIWIYKKSRWVTSLIRSNVIYWPSRGSEIVRRMPSFRGEYAPLHPKFPKGSAAACVRLTTPPPSDVEDLTYTPADNAAVEEFIRDRGDTTWHSVSLTRLFYECGWYNHITRLEPSRWSLGNKEDASILAWMSMEPQTSRSQVRVLSNTTLYDRIYATSSTDLSILPGNVGANTYCTALLVGEKAAVLIAQDLELSLPWYTESQSMLPSM